MKELITSMADWDSSSGKGLTTVVDPMIVRCGELFLRGTRGSDDPPRTWDLLDRNVHALGLFFDTLILEDRIPIFNYGDTFDAHLNPDSGIINLVNEREQILHDVNVEYAPYMQVKTAAIDELQKLYSGPQRVHRQLAKDIIDETAAAEYHWSPSLGRLENELVDDLEKKLARFLLGGLIFGAYAQLLGGQHIIQPKRSRLFLAVSLNRPSDHKYEDELFGELKRRARSSVTELSWRPTFFPFLLSISKTPENLLENALVLRKSSEINDYRKFLRDTTAGWERNGEVQAATKELEGIARAVDRRIAGDSSFPKFELKVDVADVAAMAMGVPKVPGEIDLAPPLAGLWGWFVASLPGRRHRKLLIRAILEDRKYSQIQNRIKSVWARRG